MVFSTCGVSIDVSPLAIAAFVLFMASIAAARSETLILFDMQIQIFSPSGTGLPVMQALTKSSARAWNATLEIRTHATAAARTRLLMNAPEKGAMPEASQNDLLSRVDDARPGRHR